MYFYYAFLIFCAIGSLEARQADIDINRLVSDARGLALIDKSDCDSSLHNPVAFNDGMGSTSSSTHNRPTTNSSNSTGLPQNELQRLPNQARHFYSPSFSNQGRRFVDSDSIRRSNDYDDYSSGLFQPRQSRILHPAPTPYQKEALKIHQPREDPRLFYQSDAYLKEINSKNIDHEVTAVYPGKDVIRVAQQAYRIPRLLPRKNRREESRINQVQDCIRCPHDRTLVAKAGSDRVVLQAPLLFNCLGDKAPIDVKFVHMYGPKFGTAVTSGSHITIGRITHKGETVHLCKMQVHVIIQSCPVPNYLSAQCDQHNKLCNFTCKDSRLEMQGVTSSICGDHLQWKTDLPVCRARSWCYAPIPPTNGRISCKGNPMDNGTRLPEGSKCRIRCAQAWRLSSRGVSVCRRGVWTQDLQCQPKTRYSKV